MVSQNRPVGKWHRTTLPHIFPHVAGWWCEKVPCEFVPCESVSLSRFEKLSTSDELSRMLPFPLSTTILHVCTHRMWQLHRKIWLLARRSVTIFPALLVSLLCFWYVSLTSVLLAGKGTFGSINRCTPLPTFLANELCLDLARSIYVFFTASSLSSLHRTELQTQFSELIAHTCDVKSL